MVTRIGRAYSAGQQALLRLEIQNPESIEVALAVEAHRWFWKPQNIKTIIFANSREITSQAELGHQVKVSWAKLDSQTPPNSFVRSLYCLGFGESYLVPSLDEDLNAGDQALWYSLAEMAEVEIPVSKQETLQRLEWKFRLLRKMVQRGIWLMDVSLHGGRGDRELISAWYEHYGSRVIENLESPSLVAFGKSLYDELQATGIKVDDFVYHPRGLREDEQKVHQIEAMKRIHSLTSVPQI